MPKPSPWSEADLGRLAFDDASFAAAADDVEHDATGIKLATLLVSW